MQAWSPFYAVMAGAAATLLGLLFVAVSLKAGPAFAGLQSTTRPLAAQAFRNYLVVLVTSLVSLFPDATTSMLGTVTSIVSLSALVWAVIRVVAMMRQPGGQRPRWSTLRRHAASMIGLGLVFAAAVQFWRGGADSFHSLAAGVIVLLVSSATISWQLLTQMAVLPSGRER